MYTKRCDSFCLECLVPQPQNSVFVLLESKSLHIFQRIFFHYEMKVGTPFLAFSSDANI